MGLTVLRLSDVEAGALDEAIEEALEKIAKDIENRPDLQKARSMTLKVTLTPVEMKRSNARAGLGPISFDLDWDLGTHIPGNSGITTRGFVVKGLAKINAGDPLGDEPNQMTIDDFSNVVERTLISERKAM